MSAPTPNETHSDCESIRCPYCPALFTDLWEHDWGATPLRLTCDEYGNTATVVRCVTVDYTAIAEPT